MIETHWKARPNNNSCYYSNSNFLINVDDFTKLEEESNFEFIKIKDNKTKEIYYMKNIVCLGYPFLKKTLKTIEVLSKINNPCIEKLIGFSPPKDKYNANIAIVCDLGVQSLSSILHQKTNLCNKWNDTKKLINAFGIAYGMDYLHSNNIIHCNLAPFNVFVNDNFYPKICDIVSPVKVQGNYSTIKYDSIEELSYLSPEILKGESYTKSIDVYSYGIILYEIFTGEVPFQNLSVFKLPQLVIKGERPKFVNPIPECQRKLMELCWSQDPNKRPTFSEICSELKSNLNFRQNIDENEYLHYIKTIEEDPKTPNQPIKLYPDIIIDMSDYEKVEKIGYTVNAEILKVREKSTGDLFAAKIYNKDDNITDSYLHVLNEVGYLVDSKHPAIINIIGYSFCDFNQKPKPVILIELAKNSLSDILEYKKNLSSFQEWNNTKKLINAFGIAAGMSYLHFNNIIHRDLIPENIFVDDFLFPKISNFENSLKVLNSGPYEITNYGGSVSFLAPEVLNEESYTKSIDVYSYGTILYKIFTGEVPFQNNYIGKIIKLIIEGERPKFIKPIPECQRKLIELCWSQDPNKRPTFSEIVSILRTDEFLIDVDVEEFNMYVNYIEGKISIDSIKEKIKPTNFFEILKQEKMEKFNQTDNSIIYKSIDQNVVELYIKDYTRQIKLGSGSFAKVFIIENKTNNEQYAAKILKKQINELNEEEKKCLIREINILSKIKQETIIKFIGYSKFNFNNKEKPVIITEIASNGSLENILNNERKGLNLIEWDDTKKFINIFGIASGMKYLHSLNIIHRDLKPGNVLLDQYLFPKLTDFGLSKINELDNNNVQHSNIIGTPPYTAPEIWYEYKHSKSSDVYAFAMIVYEIITGEKPFDNFYNAHHIMIEVCLKNYRPPFLIPIPDCYKNLIELCWNKDPNKRPTFEQIIDKLTSNSAFMNENVDLSEFINYTEMIHDDYFIENDNIKQTKTNFKEVKEIIHQNLKNEKIFIDENLFPKISDFGILNKFHSSDTMTFQSMLGIKNNSAYSSPEK